MSFLSMFILLSEVAYRSQIQEPNMEVLDEVGDGCEAIESIRSVEPYVVIIKDIELPSPSGIEVT